MKVGILDVNVDLIDLAGTLNKISDWLKKDGQHIIATINPEFIMAAQANPEFKKILNEADICVCDGVGLVWAGRRLAGVKLKRVTGVELVESLLIPSSQFPVTSSRIYLLGSSEGVAKAVAKKYPDADIVGAESGGRLSADNRALTDNEAMIEKINASGANILLVAFSQVKQETWIKNNLVKMPKVKVAVGVGGTFDYLSGKIKRAPKWLRAIGLEWLFRLIVQPQRFRRIFNATIKFGFLVTSSQRKLGSRKF